MAKYTAIKDEEQKKYNDHLRSCEVFWAFSDKQFEEGRAAHPLKPGEKYISIGNGGYFPNRYRDQFTAGMKEIEKWKKTAMKAAKSEEAILYELTNHECFYVGHYEGAMDVLGEHYTEDEVKAVYQKYQTASGEPSVQVAIV